MRSTDRPANPTCATCRHECRRGLPFLPFIRGQYCGHPSALDCVTGKAVTDCAEMRKAKARRGDPTSFCGLQGRNWEAREVVLTPADAPQYWGNAASLGVKLRDANDAAAKQYAAYVGELARQQEAAGD